MTTTKEMKENLYYYDDGKYMSAKELNRRIIDDYAENPKRYFTREHWTCKEPESLELHTQARIMTLYDINKDLFWRIEQLEKEVNELRKANQKD